VIRDETRPIEEAAMTDDKIQRSVAVIGFVALGTLLSVEVFGLSHSFQTGIVEYREPPVSMMNTVLNHLR